MPDAAGFERDMAERASSSQGWGEAFAALPQEIPDAGAWQRVQARLPATTRTRSRWPLWLAIAASLVLALAIPLRMQPAPPDASDAPASVTIAAGTPAAAPTMPASARTPSLAHAASGPTPVARRDPPPRVAPPQGAVRVARPAEAARTAAVPPEDLESLYVQSAQLEGLLALARDERVASGTSAALSDELDARVAGIDTALIQPGLSDAQRADLWNQRVDALQQLVGIEATARLYAARGQSYDAALVSID